MKKNPVWVQTTVSVLAIVLSLFSIYKTSQIETITRKIDFEYKKLICLQNMVGEIQLVVSKNLTSVDPSNKERFDRVAAKTEQYERIFFTYFHCLPGEVWTVIRGRIEKMRELRRTVYNPITEKVNQELLDSYVLSLSEFVVTMETISIEYLELSFAKYKELSEQ